MNQPSRPRRAADVSHWDIETDVLVIGLGCAGASAALEASAAGARVVVAERTGGGGGTSAVSGGVIYLGGGTPLQKACGFDDTPEDMFAYLKASCGPQADEAKLRLYCEGSVAHYEWLVGLGLPFKAVFYPHYSGEPPTDDGLVYSGSEESLPYADIAKPAPRGHVPQVPGQAGGLIMRTLMEALHATATGIMTDTLCETLVVADDGEVLGAVLRSDGEELTVRAVAGVILAAGGFINSKQMVATHAPTLGRCMFRVGTEGDDGRGIRMGMGAGGLAVNMSMGSVSLPIVPPKTLLKGILVNKHGQRFINEDAYYGVLGEHVVYRQDGDAFLILDSETWERPDVPREIVGVGETATELEQALELPAGSLEQTIALYNRHATDGEDPVFRKAPRWVKPLVPPFGALDCRVDTSLFAAFTLGGLATSVDGEVLDPDDATVAGLFAAGRTTACLAAPGYSSGLSIGDGTFFGRRAGRAAALRR
ncbi:MAG: 3-oxo-5alpha-steroid 4-dehydrogenase [Hyphomicrobiaceae bacterium]